MTTLPEVLALLDAVTPGEWAVDEYHGDIGISCHGAVQDPRLEYWIVERVHGDSRKIPKQPTPANNADGIVAAVNYLRANRDRLLRAEAMLAAVESGEWLLVPSEPTPAMLRPIANQGFDKHLAAGKRLQNAQLRRSTAAGEYGYQPWMVPPKTEYEVAAGQYLDMLAAAPTPPSQHGENSTIDAAMRGDGGVG